MEYYDENGNLSQSGGGGIAYNADGTERPLTEEELMAEIDSPDVEYKEDGSVWGYYHRQSIDITDKFNENGICFVKINDGNETLYLTVKYQNGFSYSSDKYIEPEMFN